MMMRQGTRRTILGILAAAFIGLLATSSATAGGRDPAVPAQASTADGAEELSAVDAVILGVVEGVTEYLPVSSTGHLIVTEKLLDLGRTDAAKEALDSYTVIIQVGAILAVLAIYWRRVLDVVQGAIGKNPDGRRLLFNILIAFSPAVVLGLAFGDTIDEHLLEPTPVALAWIVGGIVILAVVSRMRNARTSGVALEALTYKGAAVIGLVQCLSLWPGVSRSLVTIIAGVLLARLSLAAAVEFSFLLGLITLTGATALIAAKDGSAVIDVYGTTTPLIGIVAALVAAFAAVRGFVAYLNRRDLTSFGWYRIAIGVVTLILVATNAGSF